MTKSKKSQIDDKKIKIVHRMADGTIRDSINGYEIPYNNTTAITYRLIEKWAAEKHKKILNI